MESRKDIEGLFRALRDSDLDDDALRQRIIAAIARIGEPAIRPLLQQFVGMEKPRHLRKQAIDTMTIDIAVDDALEAMDRSRLGPIIDLITTGEKAIRMDAMDRAWAIGYSEATPAIIQNLYDRDTDIRITAAGALSELPDERAIPRLVELLKEGPDREREAAADALGAYRKKEVVAPLIAALDDKDPKTCFSAIESLGKVGDNEASGPLLERLRATGADEEETIWALIKALGRIGANDALGTLLDMLERGEAFYQDTIVEALGNIGDRSAYEKVLPFLDDNDEYLRKVTAEALAKMDRPRTIRLLSEKYPAKLQRFIDLPRERKDAKKYLCWSVPAGLGYSLIGSLVFSKLLEESGIRLSDNPWMHSFYVFLADVAVMVPLFAITIYYNFIVKKRFDSTLVFDGLQCDADTTASLLAPELGKKYPVKWPFDENFDEIELSVEEGTPGSQKIKVKVNTMDGCQVTVGMFEKLGKAHQIYILEKVKKVVMEGAITESNRELYKSTKTSG